MSNFLSVAAVTATVQRTLFRAIAAETSPNTVSGAKVTSLRPSSGELPTVGVNVFLYDVAPNAAFRNEDAPTRDATGALVQRPRAALDLHYLLSFHGSDATLEPQRLLGLTVRTLHGRPILTRKQIEQTLADPAFPYIADADLADEVERVKLTPLGLGFDELARVWTVFPESDYALSVAYTASVVFVEGKSAPRATQPVVTRTVTTVPLAPPVIESVAALDGGPITAASTLVLVGNALVADGMVVRTLGGDAAPATARPRRVTLDLPAIAALPLPQRVTVRAGVQTVEIVQPLQIGVPPAPHEGFSSNPAAFVLHPVVQLNGPNPKVTVSGKTTQPDGTKSATIKASVDPPVQPGQRVRLLLDQLSPAPGTTGRAYSFDGAAPAPSASHNLSFAVAGIATGSYVARIRIDDAETLPTRGPDGMPIAPKVSL